MMRAEFTKIAGVDEAGRGPLAGPLLCAAVILHPDRPIIGLRDSKQLKAHERQALRSEILAKAFAYAIIEISHLEVDRLNIFQATMEGMRRAVAALDPAPTQALIDGNKVPPGLICQARAIVKGDQLEACISAASILAKTSRDALMMEHAKNYPGYGFDVHKGYPTPAHLAALSALGACAIHRRSYAPVFKVLALQAELF